MQCEAVFNVKGAVCVRVTVLVSGLCPSMQCQDLREHTG